MEGGGLICPLKKPRLLRGFIKKVLIITVLPSILMEKNIIMKYIPKKKILINFR